MSDDQDKALRDMLAYGTGVMMDGKHVPLDQYLLDDQILLFGEGNLPPEKLAALERMEHAIRADERAKVIEECAYAEREKELVEALEPFADFFDWSEKGAPARGGLRKTDFAKARAILSKHKEKP